MPFYMQTFLLLAATTFALRPAIIPRQLEPCGISCGGGWCCLDFEKCVANPSDTVDGGWNCIVPGVTNDDGSPMTDTPYNPSADAAVFNSLASLISDQYSYLSSLTSALSITSLSVKSSLFLPTPTTLTPTITPGTSPTSPGPKSTSSTTTILSPTTTPEISSVSPSLKSTTSTSSPGSTSSASKTISSNTTSTLVPPSVIATSEMHRIQLNAASLFLLVAAIALAYLA